jgi:non-homologous end joining protein Ku
MQSLNGTILDATALIDFCYLKEWAWLQQRYSPLYIAQELLDSDQLELPTRLAANQYLTPLNLSTEEMFASFLEFGESSSLLSIADRSTIAIPRHQLLICASDDGLVIETCKVYNIAYTRTLRLLTEMVEAEHKTVIEVMAMANKLIQERGKHISAKVLTDWRTSLQKYSAG